MALSRLSPPPPPLNAPPRSNPPPPAKPRETRTVSDDTAAAERLRARHQQDGFDAPAARPAKSFQAKVEARGGACPVPIRDTYVDSDHVWVVGSESPEGHKYLALNSLGHPTKPPEDIGRLLQENIGEVFPLGATDSSDQPQKVEQGAIFKLPGIGLQHSLRFIRDGNFVQTTHTSDLSWTFQTVPGQHNFEGTVDFGVCRDVTGEQWLFQEGRGVQGEEGMKQSINNSAARLLWKEMSENAKELIDKKGYAR